MTVFSTAKTATHPTNSAVSNHKTLDCNAFDIGYVVTGQVSYLFASIIAALCALLLGMVMFWLRFRTRTCDKETDDLSFSSSPVDYCETERYNQRERPVFHTNGFSTEGHATIGKRLSYSGGCERRDGRETRRMASLPIIDCKRTSPGMNGANLRRTPDNHHRATSELYQPSKSAGESIPPKLIWDKDARASSLKERFTANFRLKRDSLSIQSTESCNETIELKSNVSSCCEAPRQDVNVCSYVNVVTSFGPNETINTELW